MIKIFIFMFLLFFRLEAVETFQSSYIYQSVNVITGEYCENQTDLQWGGAYPLSLKRIYSSGDPSFEGWCFNHPNILYPNNLENLDFDFDYTFDEKNRLKKIQTGIEDKIFHALQFHYEQDASGKNTCLVTSEDGNFVDYTFLEKEPGRIGKPHLLEKVSNSTGTEIFYTYRDHPKERRKMIHRREEPLGRYSINEYYDSFLNDVGGTLVKISDLNRDTRIGKVKLQKAPIGVDETAHISARFFYNQGYTEVYDALNNKTVYFFGKHGKLNSIQYYLDNQALYRCDRFFFNESEQIVSKTIEDSSKVIHSCETFEYDLNGNIIKQTLFGNLSGRNINPLLIDDQGYPLDNGVEHYSVHYRYSDDDKHLLLLRFEDDGSQERYFYEEKSGKINKKFKYADKELKKRQFYEYDKCGNLILSVVDDGSSENQDDLTAITERKILSFYPKMTAPGLGAPETIEEKYLDLETGFERLLKRMHFVYSEKGDPIDLSVYDEHGTLISSQFFEYDTYRRLIKQSDSERNFKSITYDRLGNKTQIVENNSTIFNMYDYSNRLIRMEKRTDEAPIEIKNFRYDLKGNKTAERDVFGNETLFQYDALGRLITILYPAIADSENSQIQPSVTYIYDIFNHVVSTKNPNGHVTETFYNVRGQPIKIAYPDGGVESYEYELNGFLKKAIAKDGSYTLYQADSITGAAIEQHYDVNNELLPSNVEKESTSQAVGPKNFSNCLGVKEKPVIHYNYNYYNKYGQNVLQFSSIEASGAVTTVTSDALGRAVKIEKTDVLGNIFYNKEMIYDALGNKIKEIYPSYRSEWKYDVCNRLIQSIEGSGSEKARQTHYRYSVEGHLETTFKPDGTLLKYQFDLQNRLIALTSSDGTIDYTYEYNSQGRLHKVKDLINQTETVREYFADDKILSETLANGLVLKNEYDVLGHRTKLVLPDHSGLRYTYENDRLKLIERVSSEGISVYSHRYLTFSAQGRVLEEQLLGNCGLLTHRYDENNCLESIVSPNWSQQLKRDSSFKLNRVHANDPGGEHISCYAYDAAGQLTEEDGETRHSFGYDFLHNRVSMDEKVVFCDELGQLVSQEEKSYSHDLNGNLIEINDGKNSTYMEYDALNRLVKVLKEGQFLIAYFYDSFGRRLSETIEKWDASKLAWVDQETQFFLYDGENEIGRSDERGCINQFRMLGAGVAADVGATVAIELKDKCYAPIHDHRGSICCLLEASTGRAEEWIRYTAFGTEKIMSSSTMNMENPWKFSSKRQDLHTGFILFGRRYYLPEIGRWMTKDPLGNPESINRYAYNLNDPVNRIDPQGLFSFSTTAAFLWGSFSSACRSVSRGMNNLVHHLSFSEHIRPSINEAGKFLLGETFLQLSGYYQDTSEMGIHGNGEINDKVRITLINGILNARIDYKESIDLISETHGGANVHYIFDATQGFCWDVLKGLFVKSGFISPQAHQIAEVWREMIDEMGGVGNGGMIYHYAHSLGGVHTKAALRLMTPEEKDMIRIFTFGSASLISDDSVNGVYNYVSVRDAICFLDPIEYINGILGYRENIIPVGEWLGIPFIDHMLESSTYEEVIRMLGHHFVYIYTSP